MTIVDQFGIKIRRFTLFCEALGRLLKKKKKKKKKKKEAISRVKRRRCVWTHRLRSVSDVCEVLALGRSFRGEL